MSRPFKETYDPSDAEKRDPIALIQQGKPLPEEYRLVLFEDKREVELFWNGRAVDFDYTSRKEMIEVQVDAGVGGVAADEVG